MAPDENEPSCTACTLASSTLARSGPAGSSGLADWERGGPLDPPRLLPPLPSPDHRGVAGGWLGPLPPEPPWVIALWSASCWYCKRGLADVARFADEVGLPLVALHVPEFPEDEAAGAPEGTLAAVGLPVGRPGLFVHRDARSWAELVAMRSWPTFLVVDGQRRATFTLVGWASHEDPAYDPLRAALEAARRT